MYGPNYRVSGGQQFCALVAGKGHHGAHHGTTQVVGAAESQVKLFRQIAAWLRDTPTEKPSDLVLFDKSIERLKETSGKLDKHVDEMDKFLKQLRRARKKAHA